MTMGISQEEFHELKRLFDQYNPDPAEHSVQGIVIEPGSLLTRRLKNHFPSGKNVLLWCDGLGGFALHENRGKDNIILTHDDPVPPRIREIT